jgi:hypothetical protein
VLLGLRAKRQLVVGLRVAETVSLSRRREPSRIPGLEIGPENKRPAGKTVALGKHPEAYTRGTPFRLRLSAGLARALKF